MSDPSALRLAPMTDPEYDAFLAEEVPGYAEENVRAGRWTREESLAKSREEFGRLLPQGRASPGHFLFTLRIAAGDVAVGSLWLAVPSSGHAFVYDLVVRPEFRRRGYARAAMQAAERVAREHGAGTIGLNVFGHNPGARALYVQLGYSTVAEQMAKPL